MGNAIKKSVLPCFGACLGVWIVQVFRHPGVWEMGDILLNFLLTFLITTLIVTPVIWLWTFIRRGRSKKEDNNAC